MERGGFALLICGLDCGTRRVQQFVGQLRGARVWEIAVGHAGGCCLLVVLGVLGGLAEVDHHLHARGLESGELSGIWLREDEAVRHAADCELGRGKRSTHLELGSLARRGLATLTHELTHAHRVGAQERDGLGIVAAFRDPHALLGRSHVDRDCPVLLEELREDGVPDANLCTDLHACLHGLGVVDDLGRDGGIV